LLAIDFDLPEAARLLEAVFVLPVVSVERVDVAVVLRVVSLDAYVLRVVPALVPIVSCGFVFVRLLAIILLPAVLLSVLPAPVVVVPDMALPDMLLPDVLLPVALVPVVLLGVLVDERVALLLDVSFFATWLPATPPATPPTTAPGGPATAAPPMAPDAAPTVVPWSRLLMLSHVVHPAKSAMIATALALRTKVAGSFMESPLIKGGGTVKRSFHGTGANQRSVCPVPSL